MLWNVLLLVVGAWLFCVIVSVGAIIIDLQLNPLPIDHIVAPRFPRAAKFLDLVRQVSVVFSSALTFVFFGVVLSHLIINAESTLSNPWLIPAMVLLGFLSYRFRSSSPVVYGLIECCVGSIAIALAVLTPGQGVLAKLLALAGGVYVIVRGLDNIGKGLDETRRRKFSLLFPK